MSKKSRRKKILAAMVGLAGASKLGLLSKSPFKGGKSGVYEAAQKARKAMKTPPTGKGPLLGVTDGITKLKRSDLPSPRNMKSIFVGSDGTITKGLEKFKNKEVYAKTMRERRGETGTGIKNFLNKVILGPKTQLNKGKMVKARGGGMAMGGMKPTKLY